MKIKQYWKEILICLLVVFSMNKCTTSCSRGNVIDRQNVELIQKDSIIKAQSDSLNILSIRWNDAQANQSTYQGIALDTKKDLIDSINILKSEKNILNQKLRQSELDNRQLKKEINILKKQ